MFHVFDVMVFVQALRFGEVAGNRQGVRLTLVDEGKDSVE